MASIKYKTFKFIEPEKLSEVEFKGLNERLNSDQNFRLIDYSINYFNFFLYEIVVVSSTLILSILYLLFENEIYVKESVVKYIGSISIGICFFSIIILIAESISYLTFVYKRNSYYKRLEILIKSYSSYKDFCYHAYPRIFQPQIKTL